MSNYNVTRFSRSARHSLKGGSIQSWIIGSFLIQLQLQLLDFFFNVIAITITNQLKLNYFLSRIQLLYNILVFRGFYLDIVLKTNSKSLFFC
jgi:hypothetical protein